MAGRSQTVWVFPASGFAASAVLAAVPGLPFSPGVWPARGPFGAFTWASWFVSVGLALTLLLLAAALGLRRGRAGDRFGPEPETPASAPVGRVLLASAGFAMLGLAAFAAAARADRIERDPLPALAVALVVLVVLRAVATRLRGGDPART